MLLALVRTAQKFQRPPSSWVGGDGTWTHQDQLLTLAYTVYEESLCAECGLPKDECQSTAYVVDARICGPSAAIERYRKEHKDPPPGQKLSVRKVDLDGPNETIASAPDWWKEQNGYNPDGSRMKGR